MHAFMAMPVATGELVRRARLVAEPLRYFGKMAFLPFLPCRILFPSFSSSSIIQAIAFLIFLVVPVASDRKYSNYLRLEERHIFHFQKYDLLNFHNELGQHLHPHQTVKYEVEHEFIGIVSNGDVPVGPWSGFKRVGSENADGICPETMLPLTTSLAIHNHIAFDLAHCAIFWTPTTLGTYSKAATVHFAFCVVSK